MSQRGKRGDELKHPTFAPTGTVRELRSELQGVSIGSFYE